MLYFYSPIFCKIVLFIHWFIYFEHLDETSYFISFKLLKLDVTWPLGWINLSRPLAWTEQSDQSILTFNLRPRSTNLDLRSELAVSTFGLDQPIMIFNLSRSFQPSIHYLLKLLLILLFYSYSLSYSSHPSLLIY